MPNPLIERLRRAFGNRRPDVHVPEATEPSPREEAPAPSMRTWRVHPAIPDLMDMLGIGSALVPGDDQGVSRIQRPGGGYWRIEYITDVDGTLDHFIEIRRNEEVPVSRLLTQDGVLEMDVTVAIPDTLVDSLPGRRLGDLISTDGPAAGMVIASVERRVFAQTQPLRIRFEPRDHVPA